MGTAEAEAKAEAEPITALQGGNMTEREKLYMPCPFCGGEAAVKLCRSESADKTYYWACTCDARGFFPDKHFRALDQAKKISIL